MIPIHPDPPIPVVPTVEEFTGKVALVTGGSDGIGKGIVAALLHVGATVYFCGRRVDQGEATRKELGDRAHFIPCDLRDLDSIDAMLERIGKEAGRLDYLVNNAGMDPCLYFHKTTLEEFNAVIETDLRAYFFVTQKSLPLLEKGDGKAIVNIGTTNYERGNGGMTAYNAAKAGILGFTRSLARELGHRGMRANIASPGWIVTEKQIKDRGMGQEAVNHLKKTQCVRETIYPEHVANVVVFLLSRASTGLSGQNLIVDGGGVLQ